MPSERKVLANRINARASTGPRTVSGKARAAHNAYRHGLSVPTAMEEAHSRQLEMLASEIAGPHACSRLRDLATGIAAAQVDLMRVREARHKLLSRVTAGSQDGLDCSMHAEPCAEAKYIEAFMAVSEQLVKIDRYERRALSRRKAAIRAFDAFRISLLGSRA